jgi:hypothetical protein
MTVNRPGVRSAFASTEVSGSIAKSAPLRKSRHSRESGNPSNWAPAPPPSRRTSFAGAMPFGTFISMGGPKAHLMAPNSVCGEGDSLSEHTGREQASFRRRTRHPSLHQSANLQSAQTWTGSVRGGRIDRSCHTPAHLFEDVGYDGGGRTGGGKTRPLPAAVPSAA